MPDLESAKVGVVVLSDGDTFQPRADKTSALVIADAHGEYYEETSRGNVWTISTALGGVSIVTSVGVLSTAANTPIVGLFNPTQNVNLHVTRAVIVMTTGTMVTGGFVWAINTTPTGITSAGVSARNNKTFIKGGHNATAFDGSAAVTGQTNAPTLFRQFGGNFAGAQGAGSNGTFEETENDIVIGPGCYAGLYTTVGATGLNVVASLSWAEIAT